MEILFLIIILASFLCTYLILPYWIKNAHSNRLTGKDMHKQDKRKLAEGGGILVLVGVSFGILLYIALNTFYFNSSSKLIYIFALLSVLLISSIVGGVDDLFGWKKGLSKKIRIIIILFAAIPLMVINAGDAIINLPFFGVVNFGILYGLGARGLAQRTGSSYEEAIEFIEKYFSIYNELQEYLEDTIALAHVQEYVETLFGRKRYLPEIGASHQQMRAQAERMAINHPIQGTAADLMKLAMIKVDKLISKEFSPDEVRMILQVHDELVFEVKDGLVKKASGMLQDEMETVEKLKVPIVVDAGVGNNWGECK